MLDALLKLVRDNAITTEQWDEHFKSILLILIETFGDSDVSMLFLNEVGRVVFKNVYIKDGEELYLKPCITRVLRMDDIF